VLNAVYGNVVYDTVFTIVGAIIILAGLYVRPFASR
jgi:uncharacterized membrane protein